MARITRWFFGTSTTTPFMTRSDHILRGTGMVVVIGGANIDLKCRTAAPTILGTSNPGVTRSSVGGVGRNVADNLARLGVVVSLVTVVGQDAAGDRILTETSAAGVNLSDVILGSAHTSSYTAVLDERGELIVAVSAMEIMEELKADAIRARRALIEAAAIVVLDCNVPEDALQLALESAAGAGIPVVIDPVSVTKAERLRIVLQAGAHVHTVTPNIAELAALLGRQPERDTECGIESDDSLRRSTRALHEQNVDCVWVRLGARGSFLSVRGGDEVRTESIPPFAANVIDVTGAGDAMLAAYVYALLNHMSPWIAARYGHAAAATTVASADTVSRSMTERALMEIVDCRITNEAR